MIKMLAFGSALLAATVPVLAVERTPEARLEAVLRGRVAGAPVRCITIRQLSSTEIVDRTALLYRVGPVIYVNRPRGGAEALRETDIPVVSSFDDRLCSPDIVRLVDRGSRGLRGQVSLGEFVPYTKARD